MYPCVYRAVFIFLHIWRFLWVLRHTLHLPAQKALRSMYNFFSLGWVVTLACFQGLIQKKGVFLRTSKTRDDSKVLGARRVPQWEGLIGLTFLGFGLLAFFVRPELKTLWLGSLLAAPYFSLLSIRTGEPAPTMRQPSLDRGCPVTESPVARWAWATVLVLAGLVWWAFELPSQTQRPSYSQLQPPDISPGVLLGIEGTSTPTAIAPVVPTGTGTSTPASNVTPVTAQATAITASPLPTTSASHTPTMVISPTLSPTPTPTWTPTNTPPLGLGLTPTAGPCAVEV